MPFESKGTDSGSIAARLRQRYLNLSSPFLKDVTLKKSPPSKLFQSVAPTEMEGDEQAYREFERGLDISSLDPEHPEQPKLKYELAEDYKSSKHCICLRSSTAYECDRCHQYFYGRLSEICEEHPQEFYLMDKRGCPFCNAPLELIKKSPISRETILKIEEAELPSDEDL
ncbi:uncharacterized protein CG13380 [Drosophila erecta]|uniref:Uncharacterized protein n=1 Tax=Drosophila erecta TaxID=7220 RepID=B3ND62_DROER|nr:uncharacterized protein CG13380 [Drosophila erecta]EDV51855.1 uncharacterized protein Dere_GG15735 [Drosophila erecta]